MTKTGALRAYYLGSVVCMAGFLFGYDSGISGGVLTLASFEESYRYTASENTKVSSLAVSLQQLGAWLACFIAWPLTAKIGRRKPLMLSSSCFCVGALIQTIDTHSLAAFYVARIVAGIGLGAASVVVPMYSAEMVSKDMRGRVGSFFQLFYTIGIFVSYWVNFGVAKDLRSEAKQWQIPIGLQLIPAALLGMGVLTLKESTRWLTCQGRHDEAWTSLTWIRGDDGEETRAEMDEIRAAVAFEIRERVGFKLQELLETRNFWLVVTGAVVFMCQQATGATAFAVYGPQYFKLLVGGGQRDLLLTALFGAVKVAACSCFVLFFADRIGRKTVLVWGAFFMAACQVTTAAVVKSKPPPGGPAVTSSGIATVALLYLFVIAYNFSWGPLPWPYVSEIFPARIREPGIAIGVSSQWLWSFVFTLTTPYMIANIGWGTFLLWGIFDLLIGVYAWTLLEETKGKSLEQIADGVLRTDRDRLAVVGPDVSSLSTRADGDGSNCDGGSKQAMHVKATRGSSR